MATQTTVDGANVAPQQSNAFERFAGLCAIIAGIGGLLYSVSFVVLHNNLLNSLFLMLGGLLFTPALTAIYNRLRETDATFALWAFLLSIVGTFGAVIHGGYDLANTVHPLASSAALADLPNAIDPRGLLTFGLAGLGLFGIAWLIGRSGQFPRGLNYLAYASAILLIVLYLGRLIIFTPTSPLILLPAVLSGFLVNPAWYIWLGLALWQGRRTT